MSDGQPQFSIGYISPQEPPQSLSLQVSEIPLEKGSSHWRFSWGDSGSNQEHCGTNPGLGGFGTALLSTGGYGGKVPIQVRSCQLLANQSRIPNFNADIVVRNGFWLRQSSLSLPWPLQELMCIADPFLTNPNSLFSFCFPNSPGHETCKIALLAHKYELKSTF